MEFLYVSGLRFEIFKANLRGNSSNFSPILQKKNTTKYPILLKLSLCKF